jgi:hypothetical protein
LLSWTQDTVAAVPQSLSGAKPKRKHSLLPVLVVLFLISYGLMSLLAVEQDRTIASQRWLITSLLGDSAELSGLKGKLIQKQRAQDLARPGAAQPQGPLAQAPTAQAPMTQAPMAQAPINQDAPGQHNRKTGKTKVTVPQRPPLGIADVVDGRRIVKTI